MDAILLELEAFPELLTRSHVEQLLGVGRRRAQQLLAPCVSRTIGSNGLADRGSFRTHLLELAKGDYDYEQRRRERVARTLDKLNRQLLEQPRVIVQAPTAVVNTTFSGLEGVAVTPGRITVEFQEPRQALEKLLGLAMAVGNNFGEFERLAGAGEEA